MTVFDLQYHFGFHYLILNSIKLIREIILKNMNFPITCILGRKGSQLRAHISSSISCNKLIL